jgi:hypothetical protein
MTGGQFTQCEVNNGKPHRCQQDVNNLFHQLDVAGIGWKEWMESATNGCDYYNSGTDWAKNVYRRASRSRDLLPEHRGRELLGGAQARAGVHHPRRSHGNHRADGHDSLEKALAAGNVPRFNMIIPNDCEQGHDPCGTNNLVGQFDSFPKERSPRSRAPSVRPNNVVFVPYDEGGTTRSPPLHRVARRARSAGSAGCLRRSLGRTTTRSSARLSRGLSGAFLKGAGTAPPIGPIWA